MKKILSILASIGLTTTVASAVVACGNNANSEVDQKTDLNSLTNLNKTIIGLPGMTTWIEALDNFLADDANKTLKDEVEVKNADVDWIAPQLGVDGLLTITAKPNSSYTGSIPVTVTGYTMALESFTDLRPKIDGSVNMTSDQALETFLKSPYNAFLANEVIVKEDSFEAPTTEVDGKFLIVPKQGSVKYTGELEGIISKLSSNPSTDN